MLKGFKMLGFKEGCFFHLNESKEPDIHEACFLHLKKSILLLKIKFSDFSLI